MRSGRGIEQPWERMDLKPCTGKAEEEENPERRTKKYRVEDRRQISEEDSEAKAIRR